MTCSKCLISGVAVFCLCVRGKLCFAQFTDTRRPLSSRSMAVILCYQYHKYGPAGTTEDFIHYSYIHYKIRIKLTCVDAQTIQ